MTSGPTDSNGLRSVAVVLSILLLGGTGCVSRSAHTQPVPSLDAGTAQEKGQQADGGLQPVQGTQTNAQMTSEVPPCTKPSPITVDTNLVHQMQMEEIQKQQEVPEEKNPEQCTDFSRWLNGFHQVWYCRMDNAVRRLDMMWLREDGTPYDYELSTFRLKSYLRVGGRSNEDSYDIKVRFRGDIALPGLEDKLHLVLDNAARDALPGQDPMNQEDQTSLSLRTIWRRLRNSEFSLSGGLKWRSSLPVVYSELDWCYNRDLLGGCFSLNPRGFWYSDDGFGQMTSMTLTRSIKGPFWVQLRTAERSTEKTDGLEFEQTGRLAWISGKEGRGIVMQGSVFPHLKSSDWYWDDSLVNLSWRDSLYRKWIYYTVTPQVDFPKEDHYSARWSLRFGLEILFGGKISNLL